MGDLVEIRHFYDVEEALCAKGFLSAQGFDVILQGEHHLGVNPMLRIAMGGYRLLAPKENELEILTLLNEIDSGARSEISEPIYLTKCRACKSSELRPAGRWFCAGLWMSFVLLFDVLSSTAFTPCNRDRRMRCRKCGKVQSGWTD